MRRFEHNGIINLYKEKDFTSHDAVAKLRGILGQKKIGHTGTLDPMAEGVLPVCLGNATKLCDMLTDSGKEYEAVLLLGVTTDTQDTTGTVLKRASSGELDGLSPKKAVSVIMSFVGEYDQIPPMYSALKVDGKRLYKLAREGKSVERQSRAVTIHNIDILSVELPRVRFRVSCSKGTYIRTLCEDIGNSLNVGGAMEELLRVRVKDFLIKDSVRLSEIGQAIEEGRLSDMIIPTEEALKDYRMIGVSDLCFDPISYDRLLKNGNSIGADFIKKEFSCKDGELFRFYDAEGSFTAIYRYDREKDLFSPYKMFL